MSAESLAAEGAMRCPKGVRLEIEPLPPGRYVTRICGVEVENGHLVIRTGATYTAPPQTPQAPLHRQRRRGRG